MMTKLLPPRFEPSIRRLLLFFVSLLFVLNVKAGIYTYIDGIRYYLEDGKATVVSNGENRFTGSSYEGNIVIPPTVIYYGKQYTVVEIEDHAFYKSIDLKSVTIPNTVTSIQDFAFSGTGITSVVIPNSVTEIQFSTFSNCKNLVSVSLPITLTSIQNWAFANCSNLSTINFPNSVVNIGMGIFDGCTSLPTDHGYRYVDSYLVEVCDKDNAAYTLKEGTRFIGYGAFRDCKRLESVVIPETVLDIDAYAFDGCESLVSVAIPNVPKLSEHIFSGCKSLASVNIPNSVQSIGRSAFEECSSLSSAVIPNSVKNIGWYAFSGCASLTSIDIPESVTDIGDFAFAGCTGLSSIVIPNSVKSISNTTFGYDAKYEIYCYPSPYVQLKDNLYYKVVLCGAPAFYLDNNVTETQSTLSCGVKKVDFDHSVDVPLLDVKKMNVYAVMSDSYKEVYGEANKTKAVVKGLKPGASYTLTFQVEYSDGALSTCRRSLNTKYLSIRTPRSLHPTSASLQDVIDLGDAGEITNGSFTIGGKQYSGKDAYVTGLTPGHGYYIRCYVFLSTGYGIDVYGDFYTPELELTTLAPKGVSSTCSIVAAKTNIGDDETSVGFQWRKSDAPETMIPKEGYAAVYGGQMEGYIKNLQPASYYNVRPFYKSEDGKYYYGEWVTFDPSDFSFFEPTVHTYAVSGITDNAAVLSGYALAGTDDVLEQGFEYWAADEAGKAPKHIPVTLVANSTDKITITAAGQKMHATIDGLKPETNYSCRAYVRTSGGTVYGESQSFTTDVSSGISTISRDADGYVVAVYDVSGRKLNNLQRGINVVKYSDGTMRKINVK